MAAGPPSSRRLVGRALGAAVLAALTALGAAACGKPAAPPASDGAPSPRIVSLVPAACAIVDTLGAREHLVGVTRYCAVDGLPVVGDMSPPPERVLAREPDVVILGDYPSQASLASRLAALEVDTLVLPFVTVADMKAATRRLGALLGVEERARAVVDAVDAALDRARAGAARRGAVSVLLIYEVDQGHVFTTGGGDHVADMLAAAGARNVAAGGPLTTRLGLEAVLARAPDVIVHAAPSARFPDDGAALAYWREALPGLPAARSGRVYVWPDDTLAQNGPGIAASLDRLGALLDRAAAVEGAP